MKSFKFLAGIDLVLLTGKRASSLRELLNGIVTLPDSVVYYHTHRFLIQHMYFSPEPPNDFAYWTTNVLLERVLGERLAAIDVANFKTVGELKAKIVETIEKGISCNGGERKSPEGMEFHFMNAKTFVIDTGIEAKDIFEFCDGLKHVTIKSVYFHMFQSRLLFERDENDFSLWLREALGENELADYISRLDPYTWTLQGLRNRLCKIIEERINE